MRDLYAEITTRIITKLEAGTLPWIKGWNAGTAVPMNAVSNRPYSGINVLLFWLSADKGYARPRYVTFKQAIEAGGNVRKGEHGEPVIYFKQLAIEDQETGEEKTIPMLRGYTVFNVDQCDNLPDKIKFGPGAGDANPDVRESLADAFIQSTGADFREGAGKPCYVPSRDFITVPTFADFHSCPEYYAAAFHETVFGRTRPTRSCRDVPRTNKRLK